jgi:hypothetical protein
MLSAVDLSLSLSLMFLFHVPVKKNAEKILDGLYYPHLKSHHRHYHHHHVAQIWTPLTIYHHLISPLTPLRRSPHPLSPLYLFSMPHTLLQKNNINNFFKQKPRTTIFSQMSEGRGGENREGGQWEKAERSEIKDEYKSSYCQLRKFLEIDGRRLGNDDVLGRWFPVRGAELEAMMMNKSSEIREKKREAWGSVEEMWDAWSPMDGGRGLAVVMMIKGRRRNALLVLGKRKRVLSFVISRCFVSLCTWINFHDQRLMC